MTSAGTMPVSFFNSDGIYFRPRAARDLLAAVKEQKVDLGIWEQLMQVVIALVWSTLLLIVAAYLPQIQENQRMRARDLQARRPDATATGTEAGNYNQELDALPQ